MKKDVIPSWSVWIIGTVITAILPFLVAFYRFGSGDFAGNYLDFVGLSDTLAFLFSVSINCMILSLDKRKITRIGLKRGVLIFSAIVAFVTGGWYFYSSGDGIDNKNPYLFLTLIGLCLINMVLGSIHEYSSERNRQEMESHSNADN